MTSVAPAPARAAPRPPERRGYEHLAPLFAELARLSPDHPRRRRLRHDLVVGHLPVAQHIARKHAYRGEHLDDLEQVAALALVHAVDRFDPARGVDFLAFAVPTITGEVLRYHRDRTALIRLPRRLREQQRDVADAVHELGQRLGRTPGPGEISAKLDIDRATLSRVLSAQHATRCVSLDEPARSDHADDGRPRLDAALGHVDHELDLVENRESLTPLLTALPDRERRIVSLRFGCGMTHTEIATRVGIPQSQVQRSLASTLAGLRRDLVGEPG